MKAIIKMCHNVKLAGSLREAWIKEGEGYYGTPGGCRYTTAPFDLSLFLNQEKAWLGLNETGDKFAWLRCSGNWMGVQVTLTEATFYLSGNRHSLCELIPQECGQWRYDAKDRRLYDEKGELMGEVVVYETHCPNASPFVCGLEPEAQKE